MVKGVSNVLKTKADDAIILQPLKAVIGVPKDYFPFKNKTK